MTTGGSNPGDHENTAGSWALEGVDAMLASAKASPRPLPAPIGDRYAFERFLGAGGMGEVWLAQQSRPRRAVALKLVRPEVARNPDWRVRLLHEAETLAALDHPGIATVHEFVEDGDRYCIVMKYVEGTTLGAHLRERNPPLEEALRLARRIAEVLDYAHSRPQPIVHRDLKPANVMVTREGGVVVLDWGIAAVMQRGADETSVTLPVAGTPPYMSPEQIEGRADRGADIWAFGCVLFECLTREPLYLPQPMTVKERVDAVLHREPNWSALESLPRHLRECVRHCLERTPSNRLRDIGDAMRLLTPGGPGADERRRHLPSNLRAAPPSSVERQGERDALRSLLDEERAVTATGPHGCGKSWIALRVARHTLDAQADGAVAIDASTLERPERLREALLSALPPADRGVTCDDPLEARLVGRAMTVVIDNADGAIDAIAALVPLLRRHDIRTLITARRCVPGTAEFRVPRLSVPLASELDLEQIVRHDAVRLFESRARLTRPSFRVDRGNATDVAEICRATDGLPALLLRYAGQVAITPPSRIRDRLLGNLPGQRTSAHRALPADTDERLLAMARDDLESATADERRLLTRLAIFAGPWTLDAAEAVCADELLAKESVADLVLALSQRSIIEFDDRGGGARFWTPEPLGRLCRTRLDETRSQRESIELRDRFVAHVAQRATLPTRRRDAGTPLDGAALARWADEIALEHGNCRRAIEIAMAAPETRDLAADIAIALQDFWYPRSLYGEATDTITALLRVRGEANDLRQMRLHSVAFKMTWLQDLTLARHHAREALRLARDLVPPAEDPTRQGSLRRLALVLNNVGLVEKELGSIEAAELALSEALGIATAMGDGVVENEIRLTLGLCALARGDDAAAVAQLTPALAAFERAGDAQRAGTAAHTLGRVALHRGDARAAARWVARALQHSPFERQPESFVHAIELAGVVAQALRRSDHAVMLLAAAQARREALGAKASPTEVALRDAALDALRATLAPAAFASLWSAGASLSADSARSIATGIDAPVA